jgi:hypothetical protein
MKARWLAVVLVLVAAGCGGNGDDKQAQSAPTTAAPTSTTSPAPGLPAFLADVRKAGLGTKDLDAADNQAAIIKLGNTMCDGIGDFGYGKVVEVVQTSNAHPTPEQASEFVRSAVTNLCPEHRDLLP